MDTEDTNAIVAATLARERLEDLLRRAHESGQLRDTDIGDEIAEHFGELLPEDVEYSYLVTIRNGGGDRALGRNEVEHLLDDHVEKYPHFEDFAPITINVQEA